MKNQKKTPDLILLVRIEQPFGQTTTKIGQGSDKQTKQGRSKFSETKELRED